MRIIAGEFRGRKLLPPEDVGVTRPVTDRVKQSLFDILTPRLEGAAVLDLFAGTGSMGLECLSRGAARAVFFEADRSAVARLNRNIATLGVGPRATVVASDLFRWFASAVGTSRSSDDATWTLSAASADIAFLDPPYRFLRERPDDLRQLAGHLGRLLTADGIVVFRHDARDALDLPALARYDERTYGGMALEFLRPAPDEA